MIEQAEIPRLLRNIFRLGTVAEVDGTLARIDIGPDDDGNPHLTAPLPWIASRAGDDASWSSLSVGEQVIVACVNGNPAIGVILGSLYQDAHPAPATEGSLARLTFADGTVITYDKEAHHLEATIGEGGTAEIRAEGGTVWHGPVTFKDDVHCEKSITADEDIAADGDVSDGTRSMAEDRDIYNDHTHPTPAGPSDKTAQTQ